MTYNPDLILLYKTEVFSSSKGNFAKIIEKRTTPKLQTSVS